MLWQQLVTDGHVRAARFRIVGSVLVVIGMTLIAASWYAGGYFLPHLRMGQMPSLENQLRSQANAPVRQRLSAMPESVLSADDLKNLVPSEELEDVTRIISAALHEGKPLADGLPIKDVKFEEFWGSKWPVNSILHITVDGLHAYAAIVKRPTRGNPQAARWIAIFRQKDKKWESVVLQGRDFVVPPKTTAVAPEDIPVTLRKLMGIKEFSP